MSFISKLFKKPKDGSGSIMGNLFRKAVNFVPVVGPAIGAAASSVFEIKQAALQQKQLAEQQASQAIANAPPTVANIMGASGYPSPSTVFPQGQANNPLALNEVGITAPRPTIPQNLNIDVDWKKGRVQLDNSSGTQNNNMLMFGMLGLGALVLLNKK
jgi:hypothetical protein